MRSHRCEYCGNVFDPVKNGTCPNCGAAVSAAVMREIEQEQAASRDRVARMKEDIVRRHEQATRSGQYGGPTRLSNASRSPFRTDASGKRRNYMPFFIIVAIFVMMLLVSLVRTAFINLRHQGSYADERVEQAATAVEPELEQTKGSLGDTLYSGDFEVTAVALRNYEIAGYEKMNLPDGYQIVTVELLVKNISDHYARIENVSALAYDADGAALITNQHAPNDKMRALKLSSAWIYPGDELVGRVFYEVPEDTACLELHIDSIMVFSIDLQ